jgi:hypothetical protein
MTLTELLIALAIASIVGAGVVAMTEAVVRVLEDGRTERERTIASAVAASRLSSVVAPSNCTLELAQNMTVFWKSDTRRDGRVQATELAWVTFNESTGELVLEWVEFPESYTPNERNRADQTCSLDEDYALLKQEYADVGHLARRVLLDEVDHVEYAIPESDCASPLSQKRVAWRISWKGATGIDATTVVTSGLHAHVIPEEDG